MRKKKRSQIVTGFLLLFLSACLWRAALHRPFNERECQTMIGEYRVFYLLNLDGMKGLGHSALLLVDPDGAGRFFSYNGMQYNLFWCLTGKEGIGRMMEDTLEPQEVEMFLKTGDFQAEGFEECDNFDRILYRWVDKDQYDQIVNAAEQYVETGKEYERLYAALKEEGTEHQKAEEEMEQFLSGDLPRYQIYSHNCDTVARELLALADEEIDTYNHSDTAWTPAGNYRELCRRVSGVWGMKRLGEDTIPEILLSY